MKKKTSRIKKNCPLVIGWRETINLPDWGIDNLVAKADTGARSSAIDVKNIHEIPGNRVQFDVMLHRKNRDFTQLVEAEISGRSRIRSSNGMVSDRLKVKTFIEIGGVRKLVELSLVNRKTMLCRVLLGRKALEKDFLVDSNQKYLFGARKRVNKKKAFKHKPEKRMKKKKLKR